MPSAALNSLKVLDLTQHIAGPYATKILGGLGARVIKVERPGRGDLLRRVGPFFRDIPAPDHGTPFLYLNTDKESVTLNLKTPTGLAMAKRLAGWADVVVENFRPGTLERLGLGYSDLAAIKEDTILVSVTDFGQTGPYRDYRLSNMTAEAIGGLMIMTGEPDREPLVLGGNQALYAAGVAAYTGAVMAVMAGRINGVGQHVDVSIAEMIANTEWKGTSGYAYDGTVRKRAGSMNEAKILPTRDGYIGAMGTSPDLIKVIGAENDERFATPEARRANTVAYGQAVEAWIADQGKEEVYHKAQAMDMTWGVVSDMKDLRDSQQYRARGFWRELDHPVVGRASYARLPFRLGELPDGPFRPAPRLGEHNEQVYGELLGYDRQDLLRLHEMGII